jgi:hypothetical protein
VPREKQIEFPPEQTHERWFEVLMFVLSLAMIGAIIGIVLTVDGSFIGPWG